MGIVQRKSLPDWFVPFTGRLVPIGHVLPAIAAAFSGSSVDVICWSIPAMGTTLLGNLGVSVGLFCCRQPVPSIQLSPALSALFSLSSASEGREHTHHSGGGVPFTAVFGVVPQSARHSPYCRFPAAP